MGIKHLFWIHATFSVALINWSKHELNQSKKALIERINNNDRNIECGERYIAPMYKWMIQNGYDVYIEDIDKTRVHVLGTPKEVEEFAREYVGEK